ncbi:MAG: hypothetical protein CVU50_05345 [Candidatus Cloacimonetes bacterium HGW-Cloacimonetes-3]|jgi:tetratricopeptide (TPR) repeat protein|nr:MAG: hypothetical protein CVU50_05345 [Candidatus Cloacimonetes bacterium HGW-Cloacimonetes-3]
MKQAMITILLICLAAFAFAEAESSPMNTYLSKPTSSSFSLAVTSLSDAISKGEKPNMSKLSLAYIAELEADRLMKELIANADSMAAGERFTLANMLLGKDDYMNAIPLYDALNRDYPNWSCPWRHKGEAYFNQKNYEAAVISLQQAIATNTEHYDAYVWMAISLNELGRYTEALKNLETALTLSPEEEESDDEAISQERIDALYKELKKKAH